MTVLVARVGSGKTAVIHAQTLRTGRMTLLFQPLVTLMVDQQTHLNALGVDLKSAIMCKGLHTRGDIDDLEAAKLQLGTYTVTWLMLNVLLVLCNSVPISNCSPQL